MTSKRKSNVKPATKSRRKPGHRPQSIPDDGLPPHSRKAGKVIVIGWNGRARRSFQPQTFLRPNSLGVTQSTYQNSQCWRHTARYFQFNPQLFSDHRLNMRDQPCRTNTIVREANGDEC